MCCLHAGSDFAVGVQKLELQRWQSIFGYEPRHINGMTGCLYDDAGIVKTLSS